MPIKYYPNELQKKLRHPIDILMARGSGTQTVSEWSFDLEDGEQTALLSFPSAWNIKSLSFHCEGSVKKRLAFSIVSGRQVVTGLNDRLWFSGQEIILRPGFYDGDGLATEVAARLTANAAFVAASMTPFVVTYDAVAPNGFSVAPSAPNTILFSIENPGASVRINSTAGPLIGFEANMAAAAVLSSNVPVPGVGGETVWLSYDDTTVTNFVSNDNIPMDVDSALKILVDAGSGESESFSESNTNMVSVRVVSEITG